LAMDTQTRTADPVQRASRVGVVNRGQQGRRDSKNR
jgi:hypothetical protein